MADAQSDFQYYAFISYKRDDERWAKWLQNSLERYKLPTVIRKESPRLPKKIRPVFRDKTDIGAGVLEQSIGSELLSSRFLIVVCSPRAVKSDWVGREIETFASFGRAENILPFIVDGVPYSNDSNECLPAAIRAITPELLGVNVNELGRSKAIVKVVARILGLRFDSLWQRHRRRMRRHKTVAAICGALAVAAVVWAWDFNRTKCDYYADMVEYADGWLPRGVVPVAKSQIAIRNSHYRFESRRGKLRKVVYANSAGTPIEHDNDEYRYRTSQSIYNHPSNRQSMPSITRLSANGRVLVDELIGGAGFDKIDLKSANQGGSSAALSANLTQGSSSIFDNARRSEIRRYVLGRNDRGFVVRKEFKRYNGENIKSCDADGIYGFDYKVDNKGRITDISYLGADLRVAPNKSGVAGCRYSYDEGGNMVSLEYIDSHGRPVGGDRGWAKQVTRYDRQGAVEALCYDAGGSLCKDRDGVAERRIGYDGSGNAVMIACFDTNGNAVVGSNGYSVLRVEYDNRGNRLSERCFGLNDLPCLDRDGVAVRRFKYDDRSNRTEIAYFGLDGKSCANRYGVARLSAQYDQRGNRTEVAYFDADGKRCSDANGYSVICFEYDDRDNRTAEFNYGADGELCVGNDGVAIRRYRYDDRGNRVVVAFFGVDSKPCLNRYGVSVLRSEYDQRGNIVRTAYFDTYNRPCPDSNGYYSVRATYNDNGDLTATSGCDRNGNSIN